MIPYFEYKPMKVSFRRKLDLASLTPQIPKIDHLKNMFIYGFVAGAVMAVVLTTLIILSLF